jgi:predicted transcriptional regulator
MKLKNTTIKLSKKTKDRLDHLKEFKRETYDEILEKMLEILTLARNSPGRARAKLIRIDRKTQAKKKSPTS